MFGFGRESSGFFSDYDRETVERLRKAYKANCLKYHPDKHPGEEAKYTEIFKAMQSEYEAILSGTTGEAYEEAKTSQYSEEELAAKIKFAVGLPGTEVELCGCWIWVSGDTRPLRDMFKANGFRWQVKKQKWFWGLTMNDKRKYRKTLSMPEIRAKYGSLRFENEAENKEAIG